MSACRCDCRLKEEFVSVVQQRGEAVIKARKQSSSLSAASAACDHMRDWILGTPKVQDMLFFFIIQARLNFTSTPICLSVKEYHFALQGTWVSMGVYSDGSYGVPEGIFYSFPVTCDKGEWSIVQGEFLSIY